MALEVPDEVPRPSAPPGATRSSQPSTEGNPPSSRRPVGRRLERLTRRLAAAAGDPGVAAEEGILGLAQRADAVELAAAVAAQPAVPDALDLALRKPARAGARELPAAGAHRAALDRSAPSRSTDASRPPPLDGRPGSPRSSTSCPPRRAPRRLPPSCRRPGVRSGAAAGRAAAAYARGLPAAGRPVRPGTPFPSPAGRAADPRADRATAKGPEPRPARGPAARRGPSALRALGVPTAWTRQLRPGDRFTAVLRMLDRMPEVDIDPATRIVAVVGPASSVLLEAHRTALDLTVETAAGPVPRTVVHVPAPPARSAPQPWRRRGTDRRRRRRRRGGRQAAGAARAVEALQAVGAGAVIAIVSSGRRARAGAGDARRARSGRRAGRRGRGASDEPAAVLQLGLPVVRLDGIPIDRYTWSAVLCAQLGAAR